MPDLAPPRLLVLDDEAALGFVLCRIAQRRGWSAEAVTTVGEFQAQLRVTPPDVILLDLQLDASDGTEQLRFLARESYRGTVVLMSGHTDAVLEAAGTLGRSLGLAIGGTLGKPASNTEVSELLTRLAAQLSDRQPARVVTGPTPVALAPLSARHIDAGLTRGELGLEFQPIVVSASRDVAGFEAFARWHHPTRGLVMPDAFIPAGEADAAVIDRLTGWVMRSAGEQSCQLRRLGLPPSVAVNLSPKNLRTRDFADRALDQILALGASASDVTLEIAEHAAIADATAPRDILARLRHNGFRLALDDFGTGGSPPEALRDLPFSEVKIDKSVVATLLTSREARTLVQSVARLAHDTGLRTVAEGVESQAIVDGLVDLGIDRVQGYHVGRPMGAALIPGWLDAWGRHGGAAPPGGDPPR